MVGTWHINRAVDIRTSDDYLMVFDTADIFQVEYTIRKSARPALGPYRPARGRMLSNNEEPESGHCCDLSAETKSRSWEDVYIAPSADVVTSTWSARSSVWFGAVLRGDNDQISVGADNIQDNTVIHVDAGIP